ncbi:response regulator [Sphingomonas sp. PB2P19]|uniref:response regulator n=1 Tax=Sphingomonas rhamnosi TaxID=3096156 RepID=UPI002FC8A8AB
MAKIIIAEDDLMIADMTEQFLNERGYEVCGIAMTVKSAIELVRLHEPDLLLLDLRLADGGLGTEVVAEVGMSDGVGILYATGNMSQLALTSENGHGCISKPYRPNDLVRALETVLDIAKTGDVPAVIPNGFHLLPSAGGGVGVAA